MSSEDNKNIVDEAKSCTTSKKKRWFPLESNPTILNGYISKLGFNTDLYEFVDVYATEEWATSMVPKSVLAVIFLYPISPVQEQHRHEESSSGAALSHEMSSQRKVWYTKQRIGNACGTIGVLHALANINVDLIQPESWISTFLHRATCDTDPLVKAEILESDDVIETLHDDATQNNNNATGRGEIDDEVLTHFIAFTNVDGMLYELDGRKDGPICHGETKQEQLLEDSCRVIKLFMERDPEELRFTILALAPK
eukprot:CAMPEP_0196803430 /NCGR_PEP_ID=MMETSP1362-20130617/2841_1 /TAXON_ID=163516 /ORGANISM="Leptocylindrus danicus, Strain CCMP1856" /LENGTH=253 /DNA_ID=CAMNT_0042175019 /DNA_START=46 /DNA_END=807 /DNA_ORIENTATION=+